VALRSPDERAREGLRPSKRFELRARTRYRCRVGPVEPAAPPGRLPLVAPEVVERIRVERAAGKSFRRIADELNADGTPTVHGGAQWWPSTIRAVLRRRIAGTTSQTQSSSTLA
jgi:hypothetical protein